MDAFTVDLPLQQLLCGRNRKNIKMIESMTNTAIYFPPPFSQMYRYCPVNAERRNPQEIFITATDPKGIELAKGKIHEHLTRMRLYMKDVTLPPPKIDSILLNRLDKVRKILEANGTFIMFPPLGSKQSTVRVNSVENLHAERTVKELMALVRSDQRVMCESCMLKFRLGRPVLHSDLVDFPTGDAASQPGGHPHDARRHMCQLGCRRLF